MPVKYKRYIAFLIVSALLFSIRIYLLWETPLIDYDSTMNFVIARNICEGDLSGLFSRRIPTVHLINAAIYSIHGTPFFLAAFHALISTLAVTLFLFWLSLKERLKITDTVLLCLMAGSSLLLVILSRYMSIESWTLFLFLIFIRYFSDWLESGNRKDLLISAAVYSLATTVNYKFFFLFPVFIGIELWVSRKKYDLKTLVFLFGIFAAPFLLYSILGIITGQGGTKYLIVQLATIFSPEHNPAHTGGTFNFDLSFYFRFLWNFHNPVLLLSLLWMSWTYRHLLFRFRQKATRSSLFILFTLIYFILILFVRKAPRSLVFIDLFLGYFLFVFILNVVRKKWIAYLLVICTIGFNLMRINMHIYSYADTSYPRVAEVIKKNKIKKLLLTTGTGIIPYLPEDVEWKVIFNDHKIDSLKAEGYTYALLDDYHILTGMSDFGRIEKGTPLFTAEEISLHSPILALEHAEFVRIGYSEAIKLSEEVNGREKNLILVRLD